MSNQERLDAITLCKVEASVIKNKVAILQRQGYRHRSDQKPRQKHYFSITQNESNYLNESGHAHFNYVMIRINGENILGVIMNGCSLVTFG